VLSTRIGVVLEASFDVVPVDGLAAPVDSERVRPVQVDAWAPPRHADEFVEGDDFAILTFAEAKEMLGKAKVDWQSTLSPRGMMVLFEGGFDLVLQKTDRRGGRRSPTPRGGLRRCAAKLGIVELSGAGRPPRTEVFFAV